MIDRLKSNTKAWQARQNRWRHNGFLGSAAMMRQQCRNMAVAKTTSVETKKIARDIWNKTLDLEISLRVRID